jgi:A/G-specific adenine glycosylase
MPEFRNLRPSEVIRAFERAGGNRRAARVTMLISNNVDELRNWFLPLGLVNRADRVIATARILVDRYGGLVPNNLDVLLALPGLGTYSARAVQCLAFDSAVPMVDESSGRLLRRVFAQAARGPAYSDRHLLEFATSILPEGGVREFNLALLDIAAKYCHAFRPECEECPLASRCAYQRAITSQLMGGEA